MPMDDYFSNINRPDEAGLVSSFSIICSLALTFMPNSDDSSSTMNGFVRSSILHPINQSSWHVKSRVIHVTAAIALVFELLRNDRVLLRTSVGQHFVESLSGWPPCNKYGCQLSVASLLKAVVHLSRFLIKSILKACAAAESMGQTESFGMNAQG